MKIYLMMMFFQQPKESQAITVNINRDSVKTLRKTHRVRRALNRLREELPPVPRWTWTPPRNLQDLRTRVKLLIPQRRTHEPTKKELRTAMFPGPFPLPREEEVLLEPLPDLTQAVNTMDLIDLHSTVDEVNQRVHQQLAALEVVAEVHRARQAVIVEEEPQVGQGACQAPSLL